MPSNKGVKRRTPLRAKTKVEAEDYKEPPVEDIINSLPEKFLLCRSYSKHNLKPLTIFHWGPEGQNFCRVSECSSCGARKEDYYLANGKKMDSRMDYPKGYLITGYGKIPTDVIMRILLGRHEIADPHALPSQITNRLTNKALAAVRGSSDSDSDATKVTKPSGRKNPKKGVANAERVG